MDGVEGRLSAVGGRWVVTSALLAAMAVAALEQTVVSTAIPSIIAQLKGFDSYPWVMSAYLLTQTVSTPLYGKLADVLGRKHVLLFGLALFGLGSMLSGLAWSMGALIAARAIQGLGAGAVMPVVLTMLGDLYSLEERAKVQGWFSGVWGVSSLAGPLVGGALTDLLSWRWVFFVTVPFAVLAAWILWTRVRERVEAREVSMDWAGGMCMIVGATALLLAVRPGSSPNVLLLGVAGVGAIGVLLRARWASDPVLPLDLLARPEVAGAMIGGFMLGGLLVGLDTYLPLFVQGVRGGTATEAGRTLTPLFLSWSFSVAVAARVVVRFGFRVTALVGAILVASGMVVLTRALGSPASSGPWIVGSLLVMGLGMGPTMLSYTLGVQNAVAWERRGVATGALLFFRTLGGALGVSGLFVMLEAGLSRRLREAGSLGIDVASALRPETHALLSAEQLRVVRSALAGPLVQVFWVMTGAVGIALACGFLLRGGRAVSRPASSKLAEELQVLASAEP